LSKPNDGSELSVEYYIQRGMMIVEPKKTVSSHTSLSLPGSHIGLVKNLLVLRETSLDRIDMTNIWAVIHWSNDVLDLYSKLDTVLEKWKHWDA
jgi:hypothetical protein